LFFLNSRPPPPPDGTDPFEFEARDYICRRNPSSLSFIELPTASHAYDFIGSAIDSCVVPIDGVVTGTPWGTDRHGIPLRSFRAFAHSITLHRSPIVHPSRDFTIHIWLKPTTLPLVKGGILGNSRQNLFTPSMYITRALGIQLILHNRISKTKQFFVVNDVFYLNQYVMITWIKEKTKQRLYRNGTFLAESTAPESIEILERFHIGNVLTPFFGIIDEVYFWDIALSEKQIRTLYEGFTIQNETKTTAPPRTAPEIPEEPTHPLEEYKGCMGWWETGQCSHSCGQGIRRIVFRSKDPDCEESKKEKCFEKPCPRPPGCEASWEIVGRECSATCGTGQKTQQYHHWSGNCPDVSNYPHVTKQADGTLQRFIPCQTGVKCTFDCKGRWTPLECVDEKCKNGCDGTCGKGWISTRFSVETPSQEGRQCFHMQGDMKHAQCDLKKCSSASKCQGGWRLGKCESDHECGKGKRVDVYNIIHEGNGKCPHKHGEKREMECDTGRPCECPGPCIFLLGGDRCGSTFLYSLLERHDQIHGASLYKEEVEEAEFRVKEPTFWNINQTVTRTEFQHYQARFPYVKGMLSIDATPANGRIPFVAENIKHFYPNSWKNLKFLWVVRNPIERALSYYRWARVHCKSDMFNNDYFCDILKQDFAHWMTDGIKRFQTCWPHDAQGIPQFDLAPDDLAYHFNLCTWANNALLFGGLFNIQIRHYFNIFDREQFLIYTLDDFHDFSKLPQQAKKLTNFLNISSEFSNALPKGRINSNSNQMKIESYINEDSFPGGIDYLNEFFRHHSDDLGRLLNRKIDWHSTGKL